MRKTKDYGSEVEHGDESERARAARAHPPDHSATPDSTMRTSPLSAGAAFATAALFVLALFSAPDGSEALTIEEINAYCASLPNSTLVIGMVTKGNAELTLQRWR